MDIIEKNFKLLVKETPTADMLDCLIERGFSHDDAVVIRNMADRGNIKDANRKILDKLRCMKNGAEAFIDILKTNSDMHMNYIYERLTGVAHVEQRENVQSLVGNSIAECEKFSRQSVDNTSPKKEQLGFHEVSADYRGSFDVSDGSIQSNSQSPVGVTECLYYRGNPETGAMRRRYEDRNDTHNDFTVKMAMVADIAVSGQLNQSLCPQELMSLKRDEAWQEHVNDENIKEVTKDMAQCEEGAYILWYSSKKETVLISIAVRHLKKECLHFKLKKSREDESYYFDSAFKDKDPVKVLSHAKTHGLIVNPLKEGKYRQV